MENEKIKLERKDKRLQYIKKSKEIRSKKAEVKWKN